MKIRLWLRLALSLTIIVFVFGGLVLFVARDAIDAGFNEYIKDNDVQRAYSLALSIEQAFSMYDQELQAQEWEHLLTAKIMPELLMGFTLFDTYTNSEISGTLQQLSLEQQSNNHTGMGRMGTPRGMGRVGQGRMGIPGGSRIIITDLEGKILFSTTQNAQEVIQEESLLIGKTGVPLTIQGRQAGSIFTGTMIDPELDLYQTTYLQSIYQAILIASAIAFVVAILVSFILFSHIISPVKEIRLAAEQLGRGAYKSRVKVERSDELGDLAKTFNSMAESLENSEIWKRQILSDSAHELRTPVSLLSGELEMMVEGVYEASPERIANMYEDVQRLSQLISEMQELSSHEAGMISMQITEISAAAFAGLIEDSMNKFQNEAQQKSVKLELQNSEKPLNFTLAVDEGKITQVIINLISNALRYTPPGGSVIVMITSDTKQVMLTVEDSGTGIPAAYRNQVFERFYRLDQHRGRDDGGTGLGLAISKEIIHAHGGSIQFQDPVKLSGASVAVTLPIST